MAELGATFEPSNEMLSNRNNGIYHNVKAVYGDDADSSGGEEVDAMLMQTDI